MQSIHAATAAAAAAHSHFNPNLDPQTRKITFEIEISAEIRLRNICLLCTQHKFHLKSNVIVEKRSLSHVCLSFSPFFFACMRARVYSVYRREHRNDFTGIFSLFDCNFFFAIG